MASNVCAGDSVVTGDFNQVRHGHSVVTMSGATTSKRFPCVRREAYSIGDFNGRRRVTSFVCRKQAFSFCVALMYYQGLLGLTFAE